MKTRTSLALLLAGLLAAGCGEKARDVKPDADKETKANEKDAKPVRAKGKPSDPPDRLEPPNVERDEPEVIVTKEPGVIRGRVLWTGPPPKAGGDAGSVSVNGRMVAVAATPAFHVDPTTKGVADVMVWLDKAPPSAASSAGADVMLTQSRGVFVPRAQFAARGSRLRLRTADDGADFLGAGLVFARHVKRGEQAQVTLSRLGRVTVRSDDRPWMASAFVHVLDHDYHAVTGRDGGFALPPLPPGEYDLLLWPAGAVREGKVIREQVRVKFADGQGASISWLLRG
jgi:hypothetical protein